MAFGRRSATPLEKRLGHRFKRPDLLELALTHRSCANEQGVPEHYERLEFLGDAVLGLVTAEWLYERHPELPEGELSKLKAQLVSRDVPRPLGRAARAGAGAAIGVGEERSGGRTKANLLADSMEALFGAIYLDAGLEAAREAILPMLEEARRRRPELAAPRRLQDPPPGGHPGAGLGPARVPPRRRVRTRPQQDLHRRMLARRQARRPRRRARARRWRSRRPRPTPWRAPRGLPAPPGGGIVGYNPASYERPASPVIVHPCELKRHIGEEVDRCTAGSTTSARAARSPSSRCAAPAASCRPWPAATTSPRRPGPTSSASPRSPTVRLSGTVKEDKRSPIGVEIQLTRLQGPLT